MQVWYSHERGAAGRIQMWALDSNRGIDRCYRDLLTILAKHDGAELLVYGQILWHANANVNDKQSDGRVQEEIDYVPAWVSNTQ